MEKNEGPIIQTEIIDQLEAMFQVGPSTATPFAVTGERYIKIVTGGIHYEGELAPILATDEKNARKFFIQAFKEYADEVTGGDYSGFTLYWRKKPALYSDTIEFNEAGDEKTLKLYLVRARLMISNKPAISEEKRWEQIEADFERASE